MTIQKKRKKSRVKFSITTKKSTGKFIFKMSSKELNLLETAGQDFNVVESMILENPKIILLKDSVSKLFSLIQTKLKQKPFNYRTIEC